MGYLFNNLEFPTPSRMTDLWNNTWIDAPEGKEIAAGHFIELGAEQHVDVETDFLSSHMPFHVAGFGGLYPNGKPWMFIMQKAPADTSARLFGDEDAHRVLRDSMTRALTYNPEAVMVKELLWHRGDLIDAYRKRGVPRGAVSGWPVADLLRGLLAECGSVPLPDIVAGYPDCAFPDVTHPCEADVFSDVFAAWGKREH